MAQQPRAAWGGRGAMDAGVCQECWLREHTGVVLGQADRPLACSAALEKCNSNSWHLFAGGEGARAQWSLFPLSLEMGFYPRQSWLRVGAVCSVLPQVWWSKSRNWWGRSSDEIT